MLLLWLLLRGPTGHALARSARAGLSRGASGCPRLVRERLPWVACARRPAGRAWAWIG